MAEREVRGGMGGGKIGGERVDGGWQRERYRQSTMTVTSGRRRRRRGPISDDDDEQGQSDDDTMTTTTTTLR